MCGIIGYAGERMAAPLLLGGLQALEYRGYDSSGIAVVNGNGAISVRKAAGKLERLRTLVAQDEPKGTIGIGHTRWATHGRPTEENAHPHRDCTGRIVVVHNGIIENYLELKQELQKQGHQFKTETDTEIVAHLVEREMRDDGLEQAVRRALKVMRGMFAIVLVSRARFERSQVRLPLRVRVGSAEGGGLYSMGPFRYARLSATHSDKHHVARRGLPRPSPRCACQLRPIHQAPDDRAAPRYERDAYLSLRG